MWICGHVTQFSRSFLNVLAFLPLPLSVALAFYMQRAVSPWYTCHYLFILSYADMYVLLPWTSLTFLLRNVHPCASTLSFRNIVFMSPQLIRKKRPKIHKESSKKTQMYPPQSKSENDGGGLHKRQNVSVARGDAQGFALGAGGTVPAVTRHLSPEEVWLCVCVCMCMRDREKK